jgi:alkylation response protein AidB-like acyl-CoA dehydrogenase
MYIPSFFPHPSLFRKVADLSAQSEAQGSIVSTVLVDLLDKGVFKCFLPLSVGGLDYNLVQAAQLFEALSWADGSVGWLAALGAGGNYFYGYYDKQTADQLFSLPNSVIAGSGAVLGTAQRLNGGYWVLGSWPHCSGADYANFFTANAVVLDHRGYPSNEILSFTFLPKDVEILKTWDAFGLKATAGHTLKVKGAFVPNEYVFDLKQAPKAHAPLICAYDFDAFAQITFTSVNFGLYQHFISELQDCLDLGHISGRLIHSEMLNKLMQQVQERRKAFYTLVQAIQTGLEEHQVNCCVAEIGRFSAEITNFFIDQAASLFSKAGMYATSERRTINRIWRDLQTACQHFLLKAY